MDKDVVIVAAGGAHDLYLKYAMYFCQPGRSFRDVERMGFYTGHEIKPQFPRILAHRDHIDLDHAAARMLQASTVDDDVALGEVIERLLRDGVLAEGSVGQMFLLSPADDPRTLTLPGPIRNASVGPRGQRVAWTQGQRYASSTALKSGPTWTDELDRVA
jgi:hypothetical protein